MTAGMLLQDASVVGAGCYNGQFAVFDVRRGAAASDATPIEHSHRCGTAAPPHRAWLPRCLPVAPSRAQQQPVPDGAGRARVRGGGQGPGVRGGLAAGQDGHRGDDRQQRRHRALVGHAQAGRAHRGALAALLVLACRTLHPGTEKGLTGECSLYQG